MSQTERIAYLDRRLRERSWVTASEVAQAFEVSPRQVKRDIEYLRWRLDAPVVYDPRSRRYKYEKPYDRFRFADERKILYSALVKGWASAAASQHLITAETLAEVEAAVPRDYRGVADRIQFEAPTVEPVDLEVFAGFCRALRDQRIVEMSYVNLAGASSRRRVEAERLLNYSGTWYLVAFDHRNESLRTFHLGRITSITVTADPVTRPADRGWKMQVDEWTNSGFGIFQGGDTVEATVRFRGAAERLVSAQQWHPSQADQRGEDERGPWLDRTIPVADPRELLGRVLSFGSEAQIVAPEEFRQRWRDEVMRMVRDIL
jgi:predicted DNA-binding transcriptional regulator YafY